MIPAIRFGRVVGQAGNHAVRAVDGEMVRFLAPTAVDFTMGGNHQIYPRYVPSGEIWYDKDLSPQAAACTVTHELIENQLMKKLKYSYDRAHEFANGVESKMRAELIAQGGLRGEQPLVVAGRWYARWLRTHRERLAA